MNKKQQRLRRARKTRSHIKTLDVYRLCVFKSLQHTYAQIIEPSTANVVAQASTLEAEIKKDLKHTGNIDAAMAIGKVIAERAKASGVEKVAFDRGGFKYHGRVKALADAAREHGLQI
ncbi:MAG: 50S ribosomal protein L18 [Gammaproteobacteria bacterium]|nr:50S ribosomal protein L18 [Gammaproteobacteria bacterium]